MKKKYIIICFGIISLISIVFIFIKTRQSETPTSITPPKPKIPNYITGPLPIEMSFKKQDFDFPKSLPTLTITKKQVDKNTITQFAQKLGFQTSLSEFQDINEGVKYFIESDKYFFVATPKMSTVKYGQNTTDIPSVVNKNISDEEFTKIATNFLVENGFYSENQVKALPLVYLKHSPSSEGLVNSERNEAEIFRVDFIFNTAEYEIIASHSSYPQIFVQILPDGQIFNSEILLIESIQKGLTEYPLKTYDELTENLDQARLISLSGDYISPSQLTIKDISNLKVEKIRLSYLLENTKGEFLQPIFILEGPSTILGSSADFATIYLPAFK